MRQRTSPEEQALEELRRLRQPGRQSPGKKKRHPWVRYTAIGLLAVICIAAAELTACRFFAPAIYEKVAEPVREATHQAVQTAGQVLEAVGQGASALMQRTGEAASALAQRMGEAASTAGQALRDWIQGSAAPPPEAPADPEAEPVKDDSSLAQPEIDPPGELLDPLISDIVERDGQEILTGGGLEIIYFNQTDEARAEQMYGTDPLSTHGCGPTAMAMAVSSLTGETVDPVEMAALCVQRGYWCRDHGSYLAMVPGVAESYGLDCRSLNPEALDEGELYTRLSSGDIVVALMTKGHFTRGGHFILLRGTTLSGEILVADPASRDRSLISWDLSLILDELSSSRHDGAPLWLLSKPLEPAEPD